MKKTVIENLSNIDSERIRIIKKSLTNQLCEYPNIFSIFAIEVEVERGGKISFYIIQVDPLGVKLYRTTQKFFQSLMKKEQLNMITSYGFNDKKKFGLFEIKDKINIYPIIEKEIRKDTKPTKKQIGTLLKAYNKIIYKNTKNSQFYIIPSLSERKRPERHERIHKNTVDSLIKKRLIVKHIGPVYCISKDAKKMLQEQALEETLKYNLNISAEEWIKTPKLMQEYITRNKGDK